MSRVEQQDTGAACRTAATVLSMMCADTLVSSSLQMGRGSRCKFYHRPSQPYRAFQLVRTVPALAACVKTTRCSAGPCMLRLILGANPKWPIRRPTMSLFVIKVLKRAYSAVGSDGVVVWQVHARGSPISSRHPHASCAVTLRDFLPLRRQDFSN
jgi:hypothetical protein